MQLFTVESGLLSRYSDELLVALPVFDYLQGKDVYLGHSVETGSGAHQASYPMDTGGDFPRRYSGRGVKLITHLHLAPRSRFVELYLQGQLNNLPSLFIVISYNWQEIKLHTE
jgi:hypothetical protein